MSDWHKKWKTELIIFKAGTSKNADLVVETDREITRLEAENAALRERVRRLEEAIKRMVLSADQHRDSYGCSEVREIGNAVLLEATDE